MDDPPRLADLSPGPWGCCAYVQQLGDPQCNQQATSHIIVGNVAALSTCGLHVHIARAVPEVIAEHPYAGWCGFPAAIWTADTNRCVIDDSGVEPARLAGVLGWLAADLASAGDR